MATESQHWYQVKCRSLQCQKVYTAFSVAYTYNTGQKLTHRSKVLLWYYSSTPAVLLKNCSNTVWVQLQYCCTPVILSSQHCSKYSCKYYSRYCTLVLNLFTPFQPCCGFSTTNSQCVYTSPMITVRCTVKSVHARPGRFCLPQGTTPRGITAWEHACCWCPIGHVANVILLHVCAGWLNPWSTMLLRCCENR